ncbi:hypothetical protein C0431_08450 [bacterium]|nr:hypothetical protein [bacterium]
MNRRDVEEWILEIGPNLASREITTPKFVRQRGWMPKIDVLESDRALLVRAELAGVTNQNIHIGINRDRNSLTIKGQRPDDLYAREEQMQAHLLEIEEGPFYREILLPKGKFRFQEIQAHHKNGILNITIPKDTPDEPILVVEQITIKRI